MRTAFQLSPNALSFSASLQWMMSFRLSSLAGCKVLIFLRVNASLGFFSLEQLFYLLIPPLNQPEFLCLPQLAMGLFDLLC